MWDAGLLKRGETWHHIRGLRASPPDLVEEVRRPLFGAALEQAEQQFLAAADVPYQSRPLNLFYGISQSGKAIAAAREPDRSHSRWMIAGHGIGFDRDALTAVTPTTFGQVSPRSNRNGSFTRLAEILDSAALPESGTMEELWRTLLEPVLHYPLVPDQQPSVMMVNDVHKNPGWFGTHLRYLDDPEYLDQLTRQYPDLGTADLSPDPTRRDNDGNQLLMFGPHDSAPGPRRYRSGRVLMPSVGGQSRTLHPLLAWWAILFSLSNLARYQPVEWTALLDIDASPVANAIEYLLDVALDSVPEILYDTLRGD